MGGIKIEFLWSWEENFVMGVGWKVLSLVDEKRNKRVLFCTFLRCIIVLLKFQGHASVSVRVQLH